MKRRITKKETVRIILSKLKVGETIPLKEAIEKAEAIRPRRRIWVDWKNEFRYYGGVVTETDNGKVVSLTEILSQERFEEIIDRSNRMMHNAKWAYNQSIKEIQKQDWNEYEKIFAAFYIGTGKKKYIIPKHKGA